MEKYRILGKTYYRFQFSVLYLAEYIHCLATGAMENYEPISGYIACEYLKRRLESWHSRSEFDETVRRLIRAAILEYENSTITPTKEYAELYLKKHPKATHNLDYRVEPGSED